MVKEDQESRKRPRLDCTESLSVHRAQYCRGAIVRVKLRHFVTYEDCEFEPGPHLNFVIGPNGSGKSSIVCAIGLGLNGSPKSLGRSDQVGEYVKHGHPSGFVEIELYRADGDSNLFVRREIKKADNSSTWFLNDKRVSAQEVKKRMADLNIQVDNLCQFLPQDRVAAFAKMNPYERLRATEEAGGNADMIKKHDQLIETAASFRTTETDYVTVKTQLEILQREQEAAQREVERVQERDRAIERVKLLQKRLAWVRSDLVVGAYNDTKQACAAKNAELQHKETEIAEARRPLDEALEQQKKVESELNNLIQDTKRAAAAAAQLKTQQGELANRCDTLQDQVVSVERSGETRRRELENERQDADRIRAEIQSFPPTPDLAVLQGKLRAINQKLANLQDTRVDLNGQRSHLNQEIDALRVRLDDANSVRERMIDRLSKSNHGLVEFSRWVDQERNRGRFVGKVYGPLAVELSIPNPDDAKFVEAAIVPQVLASFGATCEEDMVVMTDEATRRRLALMINRFSSPDDIPNPVPIETARRYGVKAWLDQCMQADPHIMSFLRDVYKIHAVALTEARDGKQMDEMYRHLPKSVGRLFSPDTAYSRSFSRYVDATSTSTRPLYPARLFVGVDAAESATLQKEIDNLLAQVRDLDQLIAANEADQNAARAEEDALKRHKEEIGNSQRRKKALHAKLVSKEAKIRSLEAAHDTEAEKERLQREIQRVVVDRSLKTSKYCGEVVAHTKLLLRRDTVAIARALAGARVQKLQTEHRHLSDTATSLRNDVHHLKTKVAELKEKARASREEARKLCPLESLAPDVKAAFDALPDDEDALEDAMAREQAKAESMHVQNAALREFDERRIKIEEYTRRLDRIMHTRQNGLQEIDKLKNEWLGPLQKLIKSINDSFSASMEAIGCAGEVRLDAADEFDKYGIDIMVRFRDDESLQALTAQRQSGGEKSVSTMLYLISLQHLTNCPFRVVDEINQGMDAINERRIFKKLVETACAPGPQYFLITPKLLPDLEYTPKMTILVVFNGPWMVPQQDWKLEAVLNVRRQALRNGS